MNPHPQPDIPGDSEAARFDNAVRRLFTVSKQDFLKAEAQKTKDKQAKQEAKKKG